MNTTDDKALPLLVLATEQALTMTQIRNWQSSFHQAGSLDGTQRYFTYTILSPKDPVKIHRLNKRWYRSEIMDASLAEMNAYAVSLEELGVTCDVSIRRFTEGIYPIDCTRKNLATVCSDVFPESLNDFVEEDTLAGYLNRWQLLVLGHNEYKPFRDRKHILIRTLEDTADVAQSVASWYLEFRCLPDYIVVESERASSTHVAAIQNAFDPSLGCRVRYVGGGSAEDIEDHLMRIHLRYLEKFAVSSAAVMYAIDIPIP